MFKYHNIYTILRQRWFKEMLQFRRFLELFQVKQFKKPSVISNGIYCDIQSCGGNSECRSTCADDGTNLYTCYVKLVDVATCEEDVAHALNMSATCPQVEIVSFIRHPRMQSEQSI